MAMKKSKRKAQHQAGIEGYKEWLKKNPKATHREKFEQFDMFIDTSLLVEDFNVLQAAAS